MGTIIQHPSLYLKQQEIAVIRGYAAAAEAAGELMEEQIALAIEQRWFTMLTPAVYNGLEKALPEVVKLEEAIAWADGSMGWVVTLCSGAGWFGGFMNRNLATAVFGDANACLAGSGAATGTAEETAEGYQVSGKWWHASGAPHNTVFTANCRMLKNGEPVIDNEGQPVIKAFAFMRSEVNIISTWQAFGLIATASHAFEVNELQVPEERMFSIDAHVTVTDGPLYQYPFLQLAEVTLAANLSGMAMHFIEEATLLLSKRPDTGNTSIEQHTLMQAQDNMVACRRLFYTALDESWQQLVNDRFVTENCLQRVSETARKLAAQSRKSVEELYPFCGLVAADKNTIINRIWRDLHTASQHNLLVYPRK